MTYNRAPGRSVLRFNTVASKSSLQPPLHLLRSFDVRAAYNIKKLANWNAKVLRKFAI